MGLFITLEGIEGAGKSTLRTSLAELCNAKEREVVVTREPGATPLGQHLRTLLLDPSLPAITATAELLLFSADRAQHVEEVIKPALARNAIVICDRYVHSTLAYQGYGRGLALEHLRQLTEITTGGLMPDLVLLLDLEPSVGLTRARERERRASGSFKTLQQSAASGSVPEWNRFEQEELAFHTRVRDGFRALAANDSRILLLDAAQSPAAVLAAAQKAVLERM
ncbi:MAG: dTMP kinase [Bdellovibrionales bacterium]|nr:dTMP kinase [Bdellovibrionales bacterium]